MTVFLLNVKWKQSIKIKNENSFCFLFLLGLPKRRSTPTQFEKYLPKPITAQHVFPWATWVGMMPSEQMGITVGNQETMHVNQVWVFTASFPWWECQNGSPVRAFGSVHLHFTNSALKWTTSWNKLLTWSWVVLVLLHWIGQSKWVMDLLKILCLAPVRSREVYSFVKWGQRSPHVCAKYNITNRPTHQYYRCTPNWKEETFSLLF